jgi:hypothetical protein
MATDPDDRQLRQYLLGVLPDERSAALEEEYFVREETLDRVWAAEDELIDDYLGERLTPDEREQFDQHYLASPVHRQRVAAARQLRAGTPRQDVAHQVTPSRISLASFLRSLFEQPLPLTAAFAALLLAIAIGGAWLVRSRMAQRVEPPTQTAIPPQPGSDKQDPALVAPAPVVLAVSLSPAGVRSAEDSPPVTIPPGTDRVVVHLESDGPPHPFTKGRAVVRTVSGRETWTGPAATEAPARAPVFARLEIPADRLVPDDYIVTLFEIHDRGPETEGFRYFLRIRAR